MDISALREALNLNDLKEIQSKFRFSNEEKLNLALLKLKEIISSDLPKDDLITDLYKHVVSAYPEINLAYAEIINLRAAQGDDYLNAFFRILSLYYAVAINIGAYLHYVCNYQHFEKQDFNLVGGEEDVKNILYTTLLGVGRVGKEFSFPAYKKSSVINQEQIQEAISKGKIFNLSLVGVVNPKIGKYVVIHFNVKEKRYEFYGSIVKDARFFVENLFEYSLSFDAGRYCIYMDFSESMDVKRKSENLQKMMKFIVSEYSILYFVEQNECLVLNNSDVLLANTNNNPS